MAILDAPRTAPGLPAGPPVKDSRTRLLEQAPIVGLGLLATLSVGFGIGTLTQFDDDWRNQTPVVVGTVTGPVEFGAPLDQAVTGLLADSETPVTEVSCPELARVEASFSDLLCRAQTAGAGMVSLIASGADGQMTVTVYSGH